MIVVEKSEYHDFLKSKFLHSTPYQTLIERGKILRYIWYFQTFKAEIDKFEFLIIMRLNY